MAEQVDSKQQNANSMAGSASESVDTLINDHDCKLYKKSQNVDRCWCLHYHQTRARCDKCSEYNLEKYADTYICLKCQQDLEQMGTIRLQDIILGNADIIKTYKLTNISKLLNTSENVIFDTFLQIYYYRLQIQSTDYDIIGNIQTNGIGEQFIKVRDSKYFICGARSWTLIPICNTMQTPIDICVELPKSIDVTPFDLTIQFDQYILPYYLKERLMHANVIGGQGLRFAGGMVY